MRIEAEALLFDNDGVLVETHHLVESAWRELAGEYGLPMEFLLGELAGVRAIDTLTRYLEPNAARAAVARLEDLEVDLASGTHSEAGALELVGQLPPRLWAIVTSASRRLAQARWEGAGLPLPDVTITADDVERGKPNPEPFLTAADRLGVAPERCVVFEDSASGGLAARAAGATPCAVGDQSWPFDPVARIADLRSVEVSVVRAGSGVVLTIDSSRGRARNPLKGG